MHNSKLSCANTYETHCSKSYKTPDKVFRKPQLKKILCNMQTLFLSAVLMFLIHASSAENHMWSLCSSGTTWNQWNYKNPGIQVKNWLKSVTDKDDKCPYAPITMSEYEFAADNLTLVDAINDTLTGVGWKIAAHYQQEHAWHAGYFYGKMDSEGHINGDKVVYLYPDFKTVLVGKFQNETMISAHEAKLKAFKCQNGIMRIKVSKPKQDAPVFKYTSKSKFRINDQVSPINVFS